MNEDNKFQTSNQIIPSRNFYGQSQFYQPFLFGIGAVNSNGTKDYTKCFLPESLGIATTATGVYKFTHKIGATTRYIVSVTPIGTTARIINTANQSADTVEVRTFNDAGTATDNAFSFVIYSF